MRNAERWQSSKYLMKRGRLRPSLNPRSLAPSSVLVAGLVGRQYQHWLRRHASGRLLDLGCGQSPLYFAYREYVSEVFCTDWPSSYHATTHVDFFCDLTKPLPLKSEVFETVVSSDVLEHLPDAELAFREIARILKPGGKLLLNTPFMYIVHEGPHDYCRHTRFSLERLAHAAGLDVLVLQEIGGAPDVITDSSAKIVGAIPIVGRPIALIAQLTVLALSSVPIWRRFTDKTASIFPLGYFMVAQRPGRNV